MRLVKFYVDGLFNQYDHSIEFPPLDETEPKGSVTMIYGGNGIGKTTLLEMLNGIMKLNFTPFRRVPFSKCVLAFSNEKRITITPNFKDKILQHIQIDFNKLKVKLKPDERGTLDDPKEQKNEKNFIEEFNKQRENFSFELIGSKRLVNDPDEDIDESLSSRSIGRRRTNGSRNYKLTSMLQKFIMASQVDSKKFFEKNEPELFEKILKTLGEDKVIKYEQKELLKRLRTINLINKKLNMARFGIITEKWDYDKINKLLKTKKEAHIAQALTTLNAFIEVLETRTEERKLIAERLLTFENIINSFYKDKTITLSEKGFKIISSKNQEITESQLSSGEKHLLYLMVKALTTQRRSTVIAIDEPEMSMNINWQRRLVKALIQCASMANPQFIFATHSPDIAANFKNTLITNYL